MNPGSLFARPFHICSCAQILAYRGYPITMYQSISLFNRNHLPTLMTILLVFAGLSIPARAGQWEPLAKIEQTAANYASKLAREKLPSATIDVIANSLDDRLHLPICKQLRASANNANPASGSVIVAIHCGDTWKLYVPVRIHTRLQVLIINRSLPRGTHLTKNEIGKARRSITDLVYGYYTRIGQAIGQVLRQNTSPGTVLTPNLLRPPLWVHRSQLVRIYTGDASFRVSTEGIALQNGTQGSIIKVRNSISNRIIQGTVIAPGEIKVVY